jgi:hypothetical protein
MIFLSKITFNFSICIGVQIVGLQYFMGWGNVHKLELVWVIKWCEGLTIHLAKPFNIKLGHYTSYLVWQQAFRTSTKLKRHHEPPPTTQWSFPPTMSAQLSTTSPKDNPMQIDKTRFKPFTKQEKHQRINNLCLYCEELSHVVHECPKKHGPRATTHHLCY